MELTFKIVLDKRHKKANETYPLKLRVFQNRAYKECSLNIAILENDWDSNLQVVLSTNDSYTALNSKLTSTKAKVQKLIFLSEDLEEFTTPEKIISQLKRKEQQKNPISKPDIIKYGEEHIAKLQIAGKIGNSIVYSCAINKLKEYCKSDKLTFEAIDYRFLENFNTTLLNKRIKVNTISLYLRTIRALFNKSIREGILEMKYYPFNSFKIKNERTINRTLTKSEISQLLALDLKVGSTIWHHRNLFALSYCFIGINFSDLLTLTKENFIDGRIVFRRSKTHKIYSIKIQSKAKEIFHYYFKSLPDCSKKFVLPFVENNSNLIILKNDILQAIKNTNDYLKKMAGLCSIDKKITTYYARYTWANIARELGYPKDMISEALGHESGNRVTGIYLDNYSNEIIDNMNDKVICSVF
ncbi:site-specific integrase [Ferruginibacter lapsinanis]|uniref:site-specific integrase n=1 Tax=Ferruginibacter lapsinanis TaxID=563172 RepID=UPI001E3E58BC|nr:site-specific integrase [Ferruginibacter lapsinanis]UEG49831.1 site-specific integrase [Ferruginibacter lapsinanis]